MQKLVFIITIQIASGPQYQWAFTFWTFCISASSLVFIFVDQLYLINLCKVLSRFWGWNYRFEGDITALFRYKMWSKTEGHSSWLGGMPMFIFLVATDNCMGYHLELLFALWLALGFKLLSWFFPLNGCLASTPLFGDVFVALDTIRCLHKFITSMLPLL